MSATAAPVRPGPGAPAPDAVAWVHDPWRETPVTAALGVCSALSLCTLALAARLPFLLAVALCVAVLATLEFAFVRFTCRLDAAGCTVTGPLGPRRMNWTQVRRVHEVPAGLRLLTTPAPHPLDAVRSLLVPMPRSRAAELRATVERLRGGTRA